MTTANKITISRFILIPIMVALLAINDTKTINLIGLEMGLYRFIGAIIFIIASITDFLDGYIARKKNQITTFGKFLDPIADKVLVISAMIYFVEVNEIFGWTVIIIIIREFLVTGIRLLAVEKGKVIAASPYGKIKTVSTMIALIVIFFNNFGLNTIVGDILWYIAVFFTVLSGVDYLLKNKTIVFESI
ncbi:MAG: CDP-diacylglycerol--glycerol-3-phosphate 3-phosphatidyltransferase [Acholeplasma sp.]|nr:CDP-diacylglycerol--glycerol-3-phosphate 3-phosphatidyltransferase [Acholeplasma sp.]